MQRSALYFDSKSFSSLFLSLVCCFYGEVSLALSQLAKTTRSNKQSVKASKKISLSFIALLCLGWYLYLAVSRLKFILNFC